MLRTMTRDNPIVYQHFDEYDKAAYAFDDSLQEQRDSYAQDVSKLSNDFLKSLRARVEAVQITRKPLSTEHLTGSTPSAYLTEVQTLICTPSTAGPLSRFCAILIHPGHKSSLDIFSITTFFSKRITAPIRVLELPTTHPVAELQSRDWQVDFITGFKRPPYFFAVVPQSVTELPKSKIVYQKECSFGDILCFETRHKLEFYQNREDFIIKG